MRFGDVEKWGGTPLELTDILHKNVWDCAWRLPRKRPQHQRTEDVYHRAPPISRPGGLALLFCSCPAFLPPEAHQSGWDLRPGCGLFGRGLIGGLGFGGISILPSRSCRVFEEKMMGRVRPG
jgi:hypothetical protein